MKKQNLFYLLAVVCLFVGFTLVATHDYRDSISAGDIQSVIGYVVGIGGTLASLYMVNKAGKINN